MDILRFLIPFLLVIVLVVLVAGIITMARGGAEGAKRSNRLMQARVIAQFAAVVLIALLLLFSTG